MMTKISILMGLGMGLFAFGAGAASYEGEYCAEAAVEHARAAYTESSGIADGDLGSYSTMTGGYLFEVTVFGPDVTGENNSRIYEIWMNDACELTSFDEVSAK